MRRKEKGAAPELDRKRREDYYDFSLLAVIILLTGFGLVMLYSTTSYTASLKYGNDMYFFSRQAKYSLIAIVLAVLLSRVNYRILWYLSRVIYILALVLMALVQSPLGRAYNGARRWLAFGPVSFQPAEVAKIAVIVYLPVMIVRMGRNLRGWRPMAKLLAAGAIQAAAARIFTQNLSTALIIMLIALSIIFVAWPKTKGFLIAAAVAAGLAAAFVLIIAGAGSSGGNFRFMRIRVWLHPEQHTESGGYQVMQALYALGSGGIFGKGLGNGTQKLGAVPEAENDMIFSIICEELGIFGGIIVISLFLYLIYRLFFIAQNAPDRFSGLMVTGIFAHISLQVILNLCVNLNVIPTTGVTLPFVSYGGTSVCLLMAEMAVALSVSRAIHFRRPDRDIWGEVVRDSYTGS